MWDALTGRPVKDPLVGHTGSVYGAATRPKPATGSSANMMAHSSRAAAMTDPHNGDLTDRPVLRLGHAVDSSLLDSRAVRPDLGQVSAHGLVR